MLPVWFSWPPRLPNFLSRHQHFHASAHGRSHSLRKNLRMPYLTAIIASIICIAATSAIYCSRVFSKPGGWLRGEVLDSLLIALLTGFFPLALGASLLGLQDDLGNGYSVSAMRSAGLDFIALFVLGATFMIFLALVKAVFRETETQEVSAQNSAQLSASVAKTDRETSLGNRSVP